jgi:hypothetical protein
MDTTSQHHLHDLGRKLIIPEAATIFEVEETTVKRHYTRYGGVRLGRKLLFFEKLVSEAVERHYATQAQSQWEMDRAMAGPGEAPRRATPQAFPLQRHSESLGSRDETPRTHAGAPSPRVNADRHGLRA